MCGRFTLFTPWEQLTLAFPWIEGTYEGRPRYNIAPSQDVAVVPNLEEKRVQLFHWGLIPHWAKDPKIGYRMINARSETLAQKPSFRTAFRRRRCLVLADGFYEWRKVEGQKRKTPYLIRLKSGEPFAFAGLWERWNSPDGSELYSCTVITTRPNELVAPIHNRMPVILHPEAHLRWLDPAERKPDELAPLLLPFPAADMTAYPVSTLVNSPSNDVPACASPAG